MTEAKDTIIANRLIKKRQMESISHVSVKNQEQIKFISTEIFFLKS